MVWGWLSWFWVYTKPGRFPDFFHFWCHFWCHSLRKTHHLSRRQPDPQALKGTWALQAFVWEQRTWHKLRPSCDFHWFPLFEESDSVWQWPVWSKKNGPYKIESSTHGKSSILNPTISQVIWITHGSFARTAVPWFFRPSPRSTPSCDSWRWETKPVWHVPSRTIFGRVLKYILEILQQLLRYLMGCFWGIYSQISWYLMGYLMVWWLRYSEISIFSHWNRMYEDV